MATAKAEKPNTHIHMNIIVDTDADKPTEREMYTTQYNGRTTKP